MKVLDIKRAHDLYLCGASLSKVASKFDITRQSLHYFFKREKLPTRPLKRYESIEYNSELYTLNLQGYYRKTTGNRELLHRQKWKDINGPIADGYQVHHKDENKKNNSIDNYELLRIDEHSRLHGFKNNQYTIRAPHKYVYNESVLCMNCGIDFWDNKKVPSYNSDRIFCSVDCKKKHMKGMPRGYSPKRIMAIIKGTI